MASSSPPTQISLSAGTTNLSPTPNPKPMSRLELQLKALFIRFFQTIGRWCDLYLSPPYPSSPSFTINIPSTISSVSGNIPLLFYTPKSYIRPSNSKSKSNFQNPSQQTLHVAATSEKKYPVVINFHGGGYVIGHPADDARFAQTLTSHPTSPSVVISVGYRLAPSHPFPTGIEDCVSAILYIFTHAASLNLDVTRIALSGFSAGAQFCFTASYRLHEELERMKREGKLEVPAGNIIKSLCVFYPPTDWTRTRSERTASNPNFKPMIPPFFQNVVEQSYLFPAIKDMANPLLSPGLASDDLILTALPEKIVMITCWQDGLLGEAEVFRERLVKLGKKVDGYTVPGVPHGWDKWPSWRKGNLSRDEAYARAVEWLVEHFE